VSAPLGPLGLHSLRKRKASVDVVHEREDRPKAAVAGVFNKAEAIGPANVDLDTSFELGQQPDAVAVKE
jgi:hypothetical protein